MIHNSSYQNYVLVGPATLYKLLGIHQIEAVMGMEKAIAFRSMRLLTLLTIVIASVAMCISMRNCTTIANSTVLLHVKLFNTNYPIANQFYCKK